MKKTVCILILAIAAFEAGAAIVAYSTTDNWSSKTVADDDTVVINNDAVVTVDQDDTMDTLRVNNQSSPVTATLDVSGNYTLNATTKIQLGVNNTGAGIITQSTGSVVSPIVQINQSGSGDLSRYDISGGALSASTRIDVNNQGALSVSGGTVTTPDLNVVSGGSANLTGGTLNMNGTLTVDGAVTLDGASILSSFDGANRTFDGAGSITMNSGTLTMDGTQAGDRIDLNNSLFEVNGGSMTLDGQVLIGNGSAAEFRVVGDAAAISFTTLNQQSVVGESGTFRFELDETGVSTIDVASWMHLEAASIVVDGSAYTGGATNILLLDAVNLATVADTNNISITGFDAGYTVSILQDQTDGNDYVMLQVIPEPATLGLFVVAAGSLLVMRRIKK